MRRLIPPIVLIAVLVASSVLAVRANDAADPGHAVSSASPPSNDTPLLSVRRTPEWLRRPTADTLLGRAIQTVLSSSSIPSARCISVHRDGVEVAKNNIGSMFIPGPLQRLITAAAVAEALPADSVFRTAVAVHSDAVISEEGVLEGDIWLIGGGDPLLGTSDYMDRFDDDRPYTDLETLADDVAARLSADGVVEVSGGIQGDESKYTPAERDYVGEETPLGPVWTAEDNADNRVGPLSALMVNEGYSAWPETDEPSENTRSSKPALDAADLFAQLLADRGIIISSRSGDEVPPQGADRATLGEIESPPVSVILARALAPDGATTAEMLLKEIGVRSGVTAVRVSAILSGETGLLRRAELPVDGTSIADGSGLSALNQTSCEMFVSLLEATEIGSPLLNAVPDSADGPLGRCLSSLDGEMRLLATSEADTTGIVGQYIATNGDLVTFAMLANEPEIGATLGQCNILQRSMVNAVSGHPYGPALDELAPLPASG